MNTADAIGVARTWVQKEATRTPGFVGAHLRGGVVDQPPEASFPAWSDVDICIISTHPAIARRKNVDVLVDGVLLECGFSSLNQYRSPEVVLTSEVSSQLRRNAILADPTGVLSSLQDVVRREYSPRRWVVARCAHQKHMIEKYLELASAGVMIGALRAFKYVAGIVAVCRLGTPTQRRCFTRMRGHLLELGELDLYEQTLDAFGCAHLSPADVDLFLDYAMAAYDAALQVRRVPPSIGLRLHPYVRPYAVEGTRELLAEGHHREAVYWIWMIHTIAQFALEFASSGKDRLSLLAAYNRLLIALSVGTPNAVRAHGERTALLTKRVFAVVDRIAENYAD